MENRYKRIEKIEDKIQSAKLTYNAWKVLFLLDDETTASQIASLLDEETAAVEAALKILAEAGLVDMLGEAELEQEPEEAEPELEIEEMTEAEPEAAAETEEIEKIEEPVEEEDTFARLMETEEVAPETTAEEFEVSEAVEEEPEDISAAIPDEGPKVALPEDDLDISVPTEPEEPLEEKETLDVDFELDHPEPAPEEPAAKAPESAAAPKVSDGDKKVVLVIDDSIVIRKMVEIALEDEEDIRIETSISGKEGLDKMDQINPDLVILDMMLPDINGVEILKTIKASKGIPVIMLSGKDSPQLVEKAKSEGADEFLPKPFRDDELVDKIKALLKKG